MIYDTIIIGAGPAGLTAGIYANRACLNALVFRDKYAVSSQICNTYEVCNYPGFNNISGQELYDNIERHAREIGVKIVDEKVIEITDFNLDVKKVKTKEKVYETKTIILATGANPKKGGFDREDDFVGNGVSYKKVYLLVRKDFLRATKILQEEVKNIENVEIIYSVLVKNIIGENKIESILYKHKDDIILSELTVDGVFVGIGINPNTELLKDKVEMSNSYIVADETCRTSIGGIFAIGDIRKKQLRQVITATSDGANVITSVQKYLLEKYK